MGTVAWRRESASDLAFPLVSGDTTTEFMAASLQIWFPESFKVQKKHQSCQVNLHDRECSKPKDILIVALQAYLATVLEFPRLGSTSALCPDQHRPVLYLSYFDTSFPTRCTSKIE